MLSLAPPVVNLPHRQALPPLGVLLTRLMWARYTSLPPHDRPADPTFLLTVAEARQLARLREYSR